MKIKNNHEGQRASQGHKRWLLIKEKTVNSKYLINEY